MKTAMEIMSQNQPTVGEVLKNERERYDNAVQEIYRLREWITDFGSYSEICTFDVLGEACRNCNSPINCKRNKK